MNENGRYEAPAEPPMQDPADAPESAENETETPTPEGVDQADANVETTDEPKPDARPKTPEDLNIPEDVSKAAEEAGISDETLMELASEYQQNGELGEESYAKLEAMGIGKGVVDKFIEGQLALQAQQRNALLSGVGGEEGYQEVVTWASENLSPEQIKAYNRIMQGGDMDAARLAIEGLHAKYTSSKGPRPLQGGREPGIQPYRSMQEYVRDLRENKAKADDPAFQAQVDARLKLSHEMGLL